MIHMMAMYHMMAIKIIMIEMAIMMLLVRSQGHGTAGAPSWTALSIIAAEQLLQRSEILRRFETLRRSVIAPERDIAATLRCRLFDSRGELSGEG